jgi:hypothetical protein
MSGVYKLMIGVDGKLITGPTAGKLVLMETPIPYAQWDRTTVALGDDMTLSGTGGVTRLTSTAEQSSLGGVFTLKGVYDRANKTLRAVYESNRTLSDFTHGTTVQFSRPVGASEDLDETDTQQDLPLPFYRYEITLSIAAIALGTPWESGDWLQVTLSLIT